VATVSVPPSTVLEVLKKSTAFLERKGVPEARHDAERLLAASLSMARLDLYLSFDRPLSEAELDATRKLVQRRGRREPLQYVLGDQPFRNLTLSVTSDTLIPRPETEEVVDWALAALDRSVAIGDDRLALLDVGTGSGCIALSMAQERSTLQVLAVDESAAAVAVAEQNGAVCGLLDRVRFAQGDLYDPAAGERFGLIVSNPPYLTPAEWDVAQEEIRDFEPRTALVGGDDGLLFYRRLFSGAPDYLHPAGAVVVEIGCDQGSSVLAIAEDAGFVEVTIHQDLGGRDRAISAWLPGMEK